ncbi:MAG: DUF554 domain-containing protein, partial [Lachnospiraceae bacterium]|nr:DUF554 domain-containing protein [Lachnospiraceae bacterium]
MIGLGTLINVAGILIGGLMGMICGRFIPERLQDTLMKANGVCVLFLGIAGTLQEMILIDNGKITTQGTLMMIISLSLGSILGEWINLEQRMEEFGSWLKIKTKNTKDSKFIDGFVTASLTVCIGAMAIVGALQDGLTGDYSTLLTKAILDLIIICVMTASLGKGCIFSAIPVALLQGFVTLLAGSIQPLMTESALSNLSYVGNMLIFCVGVNLIWKDAK